MKEQEKQIEEMAIELIHAVGNWLDISRAKSIVNILLVSGWIKPDENSVVLSKEELEAIKKDEYRRGKTQQCYDVRKQAENGTAEKILKWLKEHCDFVGFVLVETYFREQFGVEIKE